VEAELQTKLVSHHVGARDGGISLPILPAFAHDMLNVVYEADRDAVEQISAAWSGHGCETRVLPYCLSDRSGPTELNVNFDAYTSSLLPFNPEYAQYYMHHAPTGVDYVLGEACRPMLRQPMQAVTLDELMARDEFADAFPDFLSLDTQGTEYAILEGGRTTLRRVLAVYCEAEFAPIYQGQKLFCDLVALLDAAGFRLNSVKLHEGFAPLRAPIGARAGGQPFGSDVLFLRKTDTLADAIPDAEERYLALHKLAFIAVLFNLLEHGLSVIAAADALDIAPQAVRPFEGISYHAFLCRLRGAVSALPARRPPSVGEARSFAEMQARFRVPQTES
jgi:FkbM family methyltransferase